MSEARDVLFTIFGATGDLARRKLYPSLFRLYKRKMLHHNFAVIGTARREWSNEYYHEIILESIKDLITDKDEAAEFASHFYYQSHDVQDTAHYYELKQLGEKLKEQYQTNGNQIFYLAMSPQFFDIICKRLKSENILTGEGFERVIIEKPFGTDYETAKELNESLTNVFTENDVYRIDHYLGKEMIQNISVIRFSNQMFASIWNNKHIDNVQITFGEALGVEERGGYYDHTGALKDMVQNHILQVLSLLAMEPPVHFSEKEIRTEKIKVFRSIRKYSEEEALENFALAQYEAGNFDGEHYISYRDEPNVAPKSKTETFVAGKFLIDNFRWSGVPFYVRTGKRLTEKGTRINIVFKQLPLNVFSEAAHLVANPDAPLAPNVLTIYIQPTEGFSLELNGKKMGQEVSLEPIRLSYRQDSKLVANTPEAYEKLILDTLDGDQSSFSHWEEVARSWELIDVIRKSWDKHLENSEIPTYKSRTTGPPIAFDLLAKDGREWAWKPDAWYLDRGILKPED